MEVKFVKNDAVKIATSEWQVQQFKAAGWEEVAPAKKGKKESGDE